MTDKLICGKTQEEIRKAFFSKQLNPLLDSIQAEQILDPKEKASLESFLEALASEREQSKKLALKYESDDRVKLPGADELMNIPEAKKVELAKWEEAREADYMRSKTIITTARKMVADNKPIRQDQWLNWGLEVAALQYELDQLRVWKDQLYRARLTRFIDTFQISRAESEERAKLTVEYREYKNAVLFREMTEEFIMLCKKFHSGQ